MVCQYIVSSSKLLLGIYSMLGCGGKTPLLRFFAIFQPKQIQIFRVLLNMIQMKK